MDRVRLGRALGYGTRHAAKTVAAVVEAATAEPASRPGAQRPPASGTDAHTEPARVVERPPEIQSPRGRQGTRERQATAVRLENAGQGVRHFKRSFWQPLAVFSGALWLRVTGLFFGLIAFTMGGGAWRMRPGLHDGAVFPAAHRFWMFTVFGLLFGYFAVSSFVRASLRERRAAAGTG